MRVSSIFLFVIHYVYFTRFCAYHPNVFGRTCLELADICRQVGLPSGVLNVVTGLGSEVGAPLSSHPHVDKVWLFICFIVFENLLFLVTHAILLILDFHLNVEIKFQFLLIR